MLTRMLSMTQTAVGTKLLSKSLLLRSISTAPISQNYQTSIVPRRQENLPCIFRPFSSNSYAVADNHSTGRSERWQQLNQVFEKIATEPPRRDVDNQTDREERSCVTSSFLPSARVDWKKVERILSVEDYIQPSNPIKNTEAYDSLFSESKLNFRVSVVTADRNNSIEYRELLSPILKGLRELIGDTETTFDHYIEGKQVHLQGYFDCLLQHKDRKVGIVVAKWGDMKQGSANLLTSLEALADQEKLAVTHGIVTNFSDWWFYTSHDDKIQRDQRILDIGTQGPNKESLREIVELISGMLTGKDGQ